MQTKLLFSIVSIFAVSHLQLTSAEQECDKPNDPKLAPELIGEFQLTHVIGSPSAKANLLRTSSPVTCFRVKNTRSANNEVLATYSYVTNNVVTRLTGKHTSTNDGRYILVPDDIANHIKLHVDKRPSGIYVGYFCKLPENEQVIILGHKPKKQDNLDKQADEEAATIASSPNVTKVPHEPCKQ